MFILVPLGGKIYEKDGKSADFGLKWRICEIFFVSLHRNMDTENIIREIDVWIDEFTPCLKDNLTQEKKYKDYMSQEYEPVDESTMPYLVDLCAIKQYADSKGVGIAALSDEEKQQFMIPNPNYRKRRRHGIAAVF